MANDTDLTYLYNLSPSIQSKLCAFLRVAQKEWLDRIGSEFKLEKQLRESAERKVSQLETQIQKSNHRVKHYEETIRSLESDLKRSSQYHQQAEQYKAILVQEIGKLKQEEKSVALIKKELECKEKQLDEQVQQYQAILVQEMSKLKQEEKGVALIKKELESKEKQLDERERQLKLRENELLCKNKKDNPILVSERHSCSSKWRELGERENEQKQKRHQQFQENRLHRPVHIQSTESLMKDSIHKREETTNEQSLNVHQSRLSSPDTM